MARRPFVWGPHQGLCRALELTMDIALLKALNDARRSRRAAVLLTDLDSYDAAEDNEISFKEGDRITHIEAVSEDWWQGTNPHGNVGLFPGKPCFA